MGKTDPNWCFEYFGEAAEYIDTMEAENESLRQQLSAALAACEVKDSILVIVRDKHVCPHEVMFRQINESIAIKPDASALRQHDEALIERCAVICEQCGYDSVKGAADIRELKGKL